ncbi:tyrosine-type recombinase/integrase [Pseudomonas kurunegalensis]|uniref:tyrosine-type recombinase/integrase n=1 Tax=Pseudomonas kurunegalensis TaxID=485880 RepID=UPI0035562D18
MASIVKLPSGSWRAQVMRGGVRKGMTFKKHADAKRWAAEMESKLESIRAVGTAPTPKGSTVADFIDKYIEETDPVKPHGKNKKATLKRLKSEFKGVLMSEFSIIHLRDFVDKRLKQKTQDGTTVSGVTISVDLSYISTVLHWAREVRHYDVDASIANQVRSGLSRRGVNTRSNTREREATQDELSRIFEAYAKKSRQKIPMPDLIAFALASAMRQEEICKLLIEDIDEVEKTVVVRNRKHPKAKIGNDQIVPLLPAAWKIAKEHIGDRKAGRIFPYYEKSVSSSFTRICKECKIDDLHFHDLRHGAIGNLFAVGLRIEQVALISGHKDWAMLRRYTHIKARDVQKAFNDLIGNQVEKAAGTV